MQFNSCTSLSFSPGLYGYLYGLTLSNNSVSPTTTIDVATGIAADTGAVHMMQLTSPLSKQIQSSGAWSAGSGGNGLDTGVRVADTWYHVFLIRKDSDGTCDIIFSTSVVSPILPSGYGVSRRIGSVKTDGSNNVLPFTQTGDEFIWVNAASDAFENTSVGTSSTLFSLTVPPDIKVLARIRYVARTSNSAFQFTFRSTDENPSQTTTFSDGSGHQVEASSAGFHTGGEILVRTNTARQIAAIANTASGNTFSIRTVGWFDSRGRLG